MLKRIFFIFILMSISNSFYSQDIMSTAMLEIDERLKNYVVTKVDSKISTVQFTFFIQIMIIPT